MHFEETKHCIVLTYLSPNNLKFKFKIWIQTGTETEPVVGGLGSVNTGNACL